MEVSARFLKNSQVEVAARGHRVLCDQPVGNGGEDAGMSPPEFLLASLATCAGYYAAQYLKTRGLDSEGLEIRVSAEKALQPSRLSIFRVDVILKTLDPRHEAALSRSVKSCLIHNTLLAGPIIKVAIHSRELLAA